MFVKHHGPGSHVRVAGRMAEQIIHGYVASLQHVQVVEKSIVQQPAAF